LTSNPFDKKILVYVVIGLLVGSSLGYFANNIMNELKTPTDELQRSIDELNTKIANLTLSLGVLNSQNTELQEKLNLLNSQVLANKTVKIGYVATQRSTLDADYIKTIIEHDLNEYASNLGYPLSFEIVVENTANDMNAYLDKVIGFKQKGINLYVAGNGNGGADVSLSYAISNKMLVVSATSNQTDFAEDDRPRLPLFRFCPVTAYTGLTLADLMWASGIREAVILYPGDSWGDFAEYTFSAAWKAKGGVIVDTPVRFDLGKSDYSSPLQVLDSQVELTLENNGGIADRVGVLGLCREEASIIATQVTNYPHLYNVTWFGAASTVNNTVLASVAGPQIAHIKWISLKPEMPTSDSYNALSARYLALTGTQIDIYSAYLYDAIFVLAQSVIEAQSTNAVKVWGVFGRISNSTYGVTGWCGLNVNEDRIPPMYEVWKYNGTSSNTTSSILVGTLDPVKHNVNFFGELR
jgi:ABC-type branched-subunit amino acid transport system substrate-binding protein